MDKAVSEKIRLNEVGRGPAVVYLRAGGGSPSKAVDLLARDFRVLTVDPGSSGSADAALRDGLRERGVGTFSFVANGRSAYQALAFAAADQQAVEAVVLIAPPPLDSAEKEIMSRLSEFRIPVMVLLGTRDQDSPPSIGRVFRQTLTNGHVTFVYDAGADMENERPEAVAAAMEQFLSERERFLVSKQSGVLYP